MHEWALAESIIKTVTDSIKESSAVKIKKVTIGVGEMQQIDLDIFRSAIDELRRDTFLSDTIFEFMIKEAELKCNNCGFSWKLADSLKGLSAEDREAVHFIPETIHLYLKCPHCSSRDFRVESGRGIEILEIEGIKDGSKG
jgi:hydrogenase nickel incorporation protein HypA/HybF